MLSLTVESWHTFSFNNFGRFWVHDLVQGDNQNSAIQSFDFLRHTVDGVGQTDIFFDQQVVLLESLEDLSIFCMLWDFIQVDIQVCIFVFGSSIAFSLVAETVARAHTWVDLHLFVLHNLVARSAVKTYHLLVVDDCLDAAVVEFFQGARNLNCAWLRSRLTRLVSSSEGRAKETSLDV